MKPVRKYRTETIRILRCFSVARIEGNEIRDCVAPNSPDFTAFYPGYMLREFPCGFMVCKVHLLRGLDISVRI
jgi:hypothetical protein